MWCWVYAVFLMTLSVFGRHQIFYVFVSHVFNIDGDCLKSKIFIQFSSWSMSPVVLQLVVVPVLLMTR